jgi:hypothetical protein
MGEDLNTNKEKEKEKGNHWILEGLKQWHEIHSENQNDDKLISFPFDDINSDMNES